MPKTLQAPALILLILVAAVLRLVPTIDPVAPLIRSVLQPGDESPADQTATENSQIQALNEQIERLEAELEYKANSPVNLLAARVTSKTAVSFRQSLRISAGSEDGVRADASVVYDGHLIGLVHSVEPDSSSVVLIGDPDVSIPVRIGRAEGIIRAYAGGVLIDQVAGEIEAGAPVLTSGIGGLFPPGLLLGSVGAELERDIYGQYVLERPHHLFEIDMVQVLR